MNYTSKQHGTSIRDAQIKPGTAIVAEGGGQRGIYTAGVLDAFLSNGFNPFEMGVGTSAGAQNLFTYFIGLPGYAKRAIAELSAAPDFYVPYRWFGRKGILDLDFYFSQMKNNKTYTLPYRRLNRMRGKRQLLFTATRKSCLSATYLEPESHNVIDCMKASSAIPFLYKDGVRFNNDVFVDGGVADPLPVIRAYTQGARDIVVIRTVPESCNRSSWRQRIDTFNLEKALPAVLLEMLEKHEQAYAEALEFLRNPPAGANIVVIAPQQSLQSSLIGSQSQALMSDYATGSRAGTAALQHLSCWQHQFEQIAECV